MSCTGPPGSRWLISCVSRGTPRRTTRTMRRSSAMASTCAHTPSTGQVRGGAVCRCVERSRCRSIPTHHDVHAEAFVRDEVPPCFLDQPPHPAHHTRARVSCGGATSRDHGARTSNTDTSSDPGPALKLCTRRVSCAIIHIEATATDTATNNTHPLLQSAPMVSDCTAVEQASRCGGLRGGGGDRPGRIVRVDSRRVAWLHLRIRISACLFTHWPLATCARSGGRKRT